MKLRLFFLEFEGQKSIGVEIMWSKIQHGFLDFEISTNDLKKYTGKRNANHVHEAFK